MVLHRLFGKGVTQQKEELSDDVSKAEGQSSLARDVREEVVEEALGEANERRDTALHFAR